MSQETKPVCHKEAEIATLMATVDTLARTVEKWERIWAGDDKSPGMMHILRSLSERDRQRHSVFMIFIGALITIAISKGIPFFLTYMIPHAK